MPGFHNLTPTIPNVKDLIIQMILHATTVTAQQIHAKRTKSDITSYALSVSISWPLPAQNLHKLHSLTDYL
jgi:hypothetical protein